MDEKPKKPRGPPKLPWDAFDNELWRRIQAGKALPTVQTEAKYLAQWAEKEGIGRTLASKDGPAFLKLERIRERIKKRYNGSAGYQAAREYNLSLIEQPTGRPSVPSDPESDVGL